MHPAWLAPWEHGVPCTDYGPPGGTGNLLERCTAAYERFDASESVRNDRLAEEDGEDDEQSAEGDGEDDEQPAEEDVELSLFDVLGYQYQPRVAINQGRHR